MRGWLGLVTDDGRAIFRMHEGDAVELGTCADAQLLLDVRAVAFDGVWR